MIRWICRSVHREMRPGSEDALAHWRPAHDYSSFAWRASSWCALAIGIVTIQAGIGAFLLPAGVVMRVMTHQHELWRELWKGSR